MEMFSVEQVGANWVACCRACGHEQTLPAVENAATAETVTGIKCERCPSEEESVVLSGVSTTPTSTAPPTERA